MSLQYDDDDIYKYFVRPKTANCDRGNSDGISELGTKNTSFTSEDILCSGQTTEYGNNAIPRRNLHVNPFNSANNYLTSDSMEMKIQSSRINKRSISMQNERGDYLEVKRTNPIKKERIGRNMDEMERSGSVEDCIEIDEDNMNVEKEVPVFRRKPGRPAKVKHGESYLKYEESQIKRFIAEVERYPMIWDGQNPNYHKTHYQLALFAEIEAYCGDFLSKGKPEGQVARDLWKQLEKDYKDYYKRLLNAKSGCNEEQLNKFKYSIYLSFLDDPMEARKVKNAFVIGDNSMFINEQNPFKMRKSMKSMKSQDVVNDKDIKAEMLQTFKSIATTYRESTMKFDKLCDQESGSGSGFKWINVIKVLESKLGDLPEVDKIIAEGQIISFVHNLSHSFSLKSFNVAHVPSSIHSTFNHSYTSVPPPHNFIAANSDCNSPVSECVSTPQSSLYNIQQ